MIDAVPAVPTVPAVPAVPAVVPAPTPAPTGANGANSGAPISSSPHDFLDENDGYRHRRHRHRRHHYSDFDSRGTGDGSGYYYWDMPPLSLPLMVGEADLWVPPNLSTIDLASPPPPSGPIASPVAPQMTMTTQQFQLGLGPILIALSIVTLMVFLLSRK